MIKLILTIATLCMAFFSGTASGQDTKEEADRHARKIIDACWAMSEKDRHSGVTSRMRKGALDSALCMENHIIALAEQYFFPDSPDLVEETKKDLKDLRSGYGHFYWNLFNSLDSCYTKEQGVRCGAENHIVHNSKYADLLEDVLRDCYHQLYRYGIIE